MKIFGSEIALEIGKSVRTKVEAVEKVCRGCAKRNTSTRRWLNEFLLLFFSLEDRVIYLRVAFLQDTCT